MDAMAAPVPGLDLCCDEGSLFERGGGRRVGRPAFEARVAEGTPGVSSDPAAHPFDRRHEDVIEDAPGLRCIVDVDVDVSGSMGKPRTASVALP
jgi:hypothetical protein